MNKIIIIFLLSSSMLFSCGCIDMGTAGILANSSIGKYKNQDRQIGSVINDIADDIRESHKKYEFESSKRIEDTKILLKTQLELQKEILYNSIMINKIKSLINSKIASENILINETK